MEEQVGKAAEEKRPGGFGRFTLRAGVIVLLYVLSVGPTLRLNKMGLFSPKLEVVYAPVAWAYYKTPFHKPLGVYLHWWCPKFYDKNGDRKFRFENGPATRRSHITRGS